MAKQKSEVALGPFTLRGPAIVIFIAGMLTTSIVGTKAMSWIFPWADAGHKDRVQLTTRITELEKKVQAQEQELADCRAIEDFLLQKRKEDNIIAPDTTKRLRKQGSTAKPSVTPNTGVTTPGSEALNHGQTPETKD